MDVQWLYPILVAAFLAMFGWLLRNYVSGLSDDINTTHSKVDDLSKTLDRRSDELRQSVDDKIDGLDASFASVTARLADDHNLMRREIDKHDRRLIRLESWKELLSLPDSEGQRRRAYDELMDKDK